ncbi:hypothetical protein [Streptomyces sp. 900105245]
MKRLAGVLLALLAVFGLTLSAPQPAAAEDWVGGGAKILCQADGGDLFGEVLKHVSDYEGDLCEDYGKVVSKGVHKAWKAVWDSVLGDVVNSAADALRWVLKKVLTVALMGPSMDLRATGLFGQDATLAGMLTWLGLVIATFGAMWQIGKMAITGQSKHAGRAMLGWVENTVLSACGVGFVALALVAGDALTTGLVNATFDNDGDAYERIVKIMVPATIENPITMLAIVAVLLLVGFIQLIVVFLRQSAIPIQCLLLPVAGGGRVGGDATRQWAPRLITSICVVIIYKPILAIIICVGFSEFGHSQTLAEWLRGCATLILAILAPGPLTRIFAPFGEAVGAGLAAGGAGGAFQAAGSFIAGRASKDGSDGDSSGAAAPTSAVDHAQYVAQTMGKQGGAGGAGGEGEQGSDAQAQASRNSRPTVPEQGSGDGATPGNAGTGGGNGAQSGQAAGAGGAAGGAGRSAAGAAVAIQVLDGINSGIQGASGQIGSGGEQR